MNDPAFLFYTKDFVSGTSDMDVSEVGAYVRLLCYQHQNDGVPNNNKRMARICGVPLKRFLQIWETLKFKFTETRDGRLFNKRLTIEMGKRNNSSKLKTILGIFGNIIKNSNYTQEQIREIKASFNADEFLEYPDNQIKEKILSSLGGTLSVRINIANANEIDSSLLLEEGLGETSSSHVKPIVRVTAALKKLDKAGDISLDDVETQFFNGKGTEFVILEFQKYFQSIGYVYKSDPATLTCFLGWINRLNKKSIGEDYKMKKAPLVKSTPSLEADFAKFQDLRRKVGLLGDFLYQELHEDRMRYFKALLSEFGLEGTVRKAATYWAKAQCGPNRNTWRNYQAIISQVSLSDEEWQEINKGQGIEL